MTIQQHPDYHDGFFDALNGEPIWELECTPEYAAGWWAYWTARDALEQDIDTPDESWLPMSQQQVLH